MRFFLPPGGINSATVATTGVSGRCRGGSGAKSCDRYQVGDGREGVQRGPRGDSLTAATGACDGFAVRCVAAMSDHQTTLNASFPALNAPFTALKEEPKAARREQGGRDRRAGYAERAGATACGSAGNPRWQSLFRTAPGKGKGRGGGVRAAFLSISTL